MTTLAASGLNDFYATPEADLDQPVTFDGHYPSIFSPNGRIGRLQLLAYNVVLNIVVVLFAGIAVFALAMTSGGVSDELSMPVLLATYLPALLAMPMWFIWCIKRCHDFNRSGWWSLATVIPLVGLVFILIPGTQGGNDHGFKRPNRWYHWVLGLGVFAIAVLGILAAVAIPAYQQYVTAAQGL